MYLRKFAVNASKLSDDVCSMLRSVVIELLSIGRVSSVTISRFLWSCANSKETIPGLAAKSADDNGQRGVASVESAKMTEYLTDARRMVRENFTASITSVARRRLAYKLWKFQPRIG